MELTREQLTNVEPGKEPGYGLMNTFVNIPEFPSPDFKSVVRPNFDTLYSIAWLDLAKEPLIISVPDTGGRYYLLPMLDMWTDVFAGGSSGGPKRTVLRIMTPSIKSKQGSRSRRPHVGARSQSPWPSRSTRRSI
jgi:hypothetical protein